jgi:tetratricopeptide (TPR) repeat protein
MAASDASNIGEGTRLARAPDPQRLENRTASDVLPTSTVVVEAVRGQEPLFADRAAAITWGEAELPVLRRVVRLAGDSGRHEVCWQLCEVIWPLFNLRRQREAWQEVMPAGRAAAEECGAPHAAARMLDALGSLAMSRQDPESATQYFSRARERWQDSGHAQGRASNLESLGVAAAARGAPGEAVDYFQHSLRAHKALEDRRGAAIQQRQLARAHHAAGDREAAAHHYRSALAAFSDPDDAFQRLRVLHGLAAVHLDDGEAAQAAALAGQAADLAEGLGA